MEYNYYLRQTYRSDGSVWVCIHEAATAEKLGYQDGDKYVQDDCTIFKALYPVGWLVPASLRILFVS